MSDVWAAAWVGDAVIRWSFTAAAIGTVIGWALVVWGAHAAIGVAVCAVAVIVWCGVRAVQHDRRR
jgi:hypothetical protein